MNVALFDLDGTIIGNKRKKEKIRREIARELGVREFDDEEYYRVYRNSIHNKKIDTKVPVFTEIYESKKIGKKFAKEYQKRSLESTFVYSDAKDVLENLNITKGIVTDGPRKVQSEKIERFELGKYFEEVIISGEIGKSKPNPRMFHLILESLGANSQDALYVGNMAKLDVAGAKNAGITSVLIRRNVENKDPDPKPDYEINNMRELYNIIG